MEIAPDQKKEIPTKGPSVFTHLVRFRSTNVEFRLPELESLASLFNERIKYNYEQIPFVSSQENQVESPFMETSFESLDNIKKIAGRSIAIMNIFEYFECGNSIDELAEKVNNSLWKYEKYIDGTSFKFEVDSFGKKYQRDEQIQIISKFKNFPLWHKDPLSLDNPKKVFQIMIDIGNRGNKDKPRKVYFGLKLVDGNSGLIDKFEVIKRKYIGTTSMESELCILVANQAKANEKSLILDPFVGTGSLLMTCSYFGSMTIGSDLDIRVIKGNSDANIKSNFEQHNIQHKLVDLVACDNSRSVWRYSPFLDAIVADPPYGIRAGARKVGKKNSTYFKTHKESNSYDFKIPQCIAYEIPDVLRDLLDFAARTLRLGGRLVYWLPSTDLYTDAELPLHPCMKIIANSEQMLTTRWRRRLITMEKFIEFKNEYLNLPVEEFGQTILSFSPTFWLKKDFSKDSDSIVNK